MTAKTRCIPTAVVVAILVTCRVWCPGAVVAASAADGAMVHALPFTLGPGLFDPADHAGSLTTLATFYALHDALAKPMPGGAMMPGLAESWSVTHDGLVYEFVLRSRRPPLPPGKAPLDRDAETRRV